MLSQSQLELAVGRADVVAMFAFDSAMRYFHLGDVERSYWKSHETLVDPKSPLTFEGKSFVVVRGDLSQPISFSDTMPSPFPGMNPYLKGAVSRVVAPAGLLNQRAFDYHTWRR